MYRRAKKLVRQGREFDALMVLQEQNGLSFDKARELVDAFLRGEVGGEAAGGERESTFQSGSRGSLLHKSVKRLVRQGRGFDALMLLQERDGLSFDQARELVDGLLRREAAAGATTGERESTVWMEEARPIPRDVRKAVLDRDEYICRYCGHRSQTIEVDHVIPVSKGGTSTPDNLVTACRDCNRRKGGRRPKEAGMEVLPEGTLRQD